MFKAWRDYFEYSYLNEGTLDPTKHYIFVEFPHGVFPISELIAGVCVCVRARGRALRRPWQQQARACVAGWLLGGRSAPALDPWTVTPPSHTHHHTPPHATTHHHAPPHHTAPTAHAKTCSRPGSLCQVIWPSFSIFALAASSVFTIPFWRHFTAWLGAVEATPGNFKRVCSCVCVCVCVCVCFWCVCVCVCVLCRAPSSAAGRRSCGGARRCNNTMRTACSPLLCVCVCVCVCFRPAAAAQGQRGGHRGRHRRDVHAGACRVRVVCVCVVCVCVLCVCVCVCVCVLGERGEGAAKRTWTAVWVCVCAMVTCCSTLAHCRAAHLLS
jgi:hypothetical protein